MQKYMSIMKHNVYDEKIQVQFKELESKIEERAYKNQTNNAIQNINMKIQNINESYSQKEQC